MTNRSPTPSLGRSTEHFFNVRGLHKRLNGEQLPQPRTNHVHVVVTSNSHSGDIVRDQLKANCARVLREHWPLFCDRPVWTIGGDWQCINTEDDLEIVICYVSEAQDRMGLRD